MLQFTIFRILLGFFKINFKVSNLPYFNQTFCTDNTHLKLHAPITKLDWGNNASTITIKMTNKVFRNLWGSTAVNNSMKSWLKMKKSGIGHYELMQQKLHLCLYHNNAYLSKLLFDFTCVLDRFDMLPLHCLLKWRGWINSFFAYIQYFLVCWYCDNLTINTNYLSNQGVYVATLASNQQYSRSSFNLKKSWDFMIFMLMDGWPNRIKAR